VILGGPKLKRKLVSDAHRVLAVFLRHAGGPLKQSQDFLARLVESVLAVRNRNVGLWPNLIVLLHVCDPLRPSQSLSAPAGDPPNFHIDAAMLKVVAARDVRCLEKNGAQQRS
jgi:hypothetical protein